MSTAILTLVIAISGFALCLVIVGVGNGIINAIDRLGRRLP